MSVWYDPRAAINPDGTVSVTDVDVQFFDVSDEAHANPLTVEDANHLATNKLQVQNYILPGFWGPDSGTVVAVAGNLVTPVTAVAGLRDDAAASREAAESAAAAASGAVASAVLGVTAGANVTVDNTDPQHPKISATGGGGGGTALTSYVGQVETLSDYPEDFPPEAHTHPIDEVTGLSSALNGKANTTHSHPVSQISDATSLGRSLMQVADASSARDLIGAGTGSGSSDISWGTIPGQPAVIAAGASAQAARAAIGAGTSSLALGTAAGTALEATATAQAATKLANSRTINGHPFDGTQNVTLSASDLSAGTLNYAVATPGSRFTILRDGTSAWPARPSDRADIFFDWEGAGDDPAIVSSGTGGMRAGDHRIVTGD